MNNSVLYYPTIEFQSDLWVKSALCIWEKLYRIVPNTYLPNDSDEVKEAVDAGVIEDIHLSADDLSQCAELFERFWNQVPMHPAGIEDREPVNLHEDKVDLRLRPLFQSLSEKFPKDGMLRVSKEIADTYVLFLADVISRRRCIQKLTDDPDVFALMHYFANDGNFDESIFDAEAQEASLAITFPAVLPAGLDPAPIKTVLQFARKYRADQAEFRERVSKFAAELSKVEDQKHARNLIDEFDSSLTGNNQKWFRILEREGMSFVTSFLSVGFPAALTAVGTFVSTGGSINSAPTVIGSLGIGCVATMAQVVSSRRSGWTSADSFYYSRLHRQFDTPHGRVATPAYGTIFNEFIND
ncbi:MAG: DUF6236 family protein [Verrucomicrobiota bacterium]